MVEIRDYIPGDEIRGNWREPANGVFETAFFTKTILHDDQPIGIIGCNLFNHRIGVIFMVVGDGCKAVGRDFSDMVKMTLDTEPQNHGLTKLYALIDSANGVNKKWIERLGFKHEYTMKNAGIDHQDMYGYAWERRQ